MGQPTVKSLWF